MIIKRTSQFKRNYKKMMKKHFNPDALPKVLDLLINNESDILTTQYSDHALKGDLKSFRELHLDKGGDWLLMYQINSDELSLILINTGSHDDLF